MCKALVFSGFKSTHILTVLSFLGTTTMPAHHGVCVSTLDTIPFGLTHPVLSDGVVVEPCELCILQMALPLV